MKTSIYLFALICALASCDSQSNSGESQTEEPEEATLPEQASDKEISPEPGTYDPRSVDDAAAEWIGSLLVTDYVADDLDYLDEADRKFQFFRIDLNEDGEEEYFIRFMSSWFCGSGGCTFLLLSSDGELITKFTVTNPPVYVEPSTKNGWSVLLVRDRGEWRELVFEDGSYPENPTVLPEAPYDAPSGHAQVLFDEQYGKAKTYTF